MNSLSLDSEICPLISFRVCSDVANHLGCISNARVQCRVHTMDESRARKHTTTLFHARGREGNDGSGVGYVTHEPPLRMAERSPAAKQSIYAFKMAARNATHPTPNLPLPRPTYTPCHLLPLSATALTRRALYIPLTYAPEAL